LQENLKKFRPVDDPGKYGQRRPKRRSISLRVIVSIVGRPWGHNVP